ncbi:hypothetical protein, partial [Mesorhizobium sp. M1295]|uniref:hypothetical protein n=1 Tax=Mesorhizobium sp. M1295 TaxID=2957076 RepID=UPI003338E2C9
MIELDPVVADPRPAELRLIQPLGIKTHAAAVPPDYLDPVRAIIDILHMVSALRRLPIAGIRCLGARCR